MESDNAKPSPRYSGESRVERIRRMGIKDLWVGDPNDALHIDWLEEWRQEWGLEDDANDSSGKDWPDDKPKL